MTTGSTGTKSGKSGAKRKPGQNRSLEFAKRAVNRDYAAEYAARKLNKPINRRPKEAIIKRPAASSRKPAPIGGESDEDQVHGWPAAKAVDILVVLEKLGAPDARSYLEDLTPSTLRSYMLYLGKEPGGKEWNIATLLKLVY